MRSGFCLPLVSALGPVLSSVSPDLSKLFVLASGLPLPSILSRSDSLKMLSLMFHGHILYILSNIITYICDYPEGEECVALYIDVVKQAKNFFDIGLVFAEGLIKAIKKEKSWTFAEWSINEVEQLRAPLSCYVITVKIRQTCHQGALTMINKHWGPEVTAYFCSHNKSEKTLRQLFHLSNNCFSYPEV